MTITRKSFYSILLLNTSDHLYTPQVFAITVAVILFIVETMPAVKKELENPNKIVKTTFFVAETICVLFFTVELIGKKL